jgi:hypothetical protein
MIKFKVGTSVQQVITPIQGEVVDYQLNKDTGEISYLVEYKNEQGETASRHFDESQIKELVE